MPCDKYGREQITESRGAKYFRTRQKDILCVDNLVFKAVNTLKTGTKHFAM